MAAKMKGIYNKGFKCISQIFDGKEREMEIGYPTDVKHVAHIGWDGASGTAPTWMNEFKPGAELLSPRPSFGNQRHSNSFALSIGSSQDFDQAMGQQPVKDMFRDMASTKRDLPGIPKQQKRKKKSSSSSSHSFSSTSSRSKPTYKSATSILT